MKKPPLDRERRLCFIAAGDLTSPRPCLIWRNILSGQAC
jgi:hypothetical protein